MNSVDFLPERIRRQRQSRARHIRQGYLLVLLVAGLVVLGLVRSHAVREARAELHLLRKRTANAERQLAMRRSLEGELKDLLIKKRIDERLGSRANVLAVLSELQSVLPPSMSLTALDVETVEVQDGRRGKARGAGPRGTIPKAASVGGSDTAESRVHVTLTGLAPTDVDVANFIGQLSASPLFEDVSMSYARNVEFRGRSARAWKASCLVIR